MKYDIKNMSIWMKDSDSEQKNSSSGMKNVTIEDMNLSVRSFNSLKRAGCSTVGDILDAMGEDGDGLRRIRNLGARSEAEIKEKLEQLRVEYASGTAAGRQTDASIFSSGKAQNASLSLSEASQDGTEEHSRAEAFNNLYSGATEVIVISSQSTESMEPRITLRPAKALWDREIGAFHLSHYAEERLRSCGISRLKDLYATHPKNEPGWYAVRELFRKITEIR